MKFDLDEEAIVGAIHAAVTVAVVQGVGDWRLKDAIQKAAAGAVAAIDLPGMVAAELARQMATEGERIVQEAVTVALPGIRVAMATAVETLATAMAVGLETGHPGSYDIEGRAKWNAALARVRGTGMGT